MASERAVAALSKNIAKFNAKIADLDTELDADQIQELQDSIADLEANLERWANK